MRSPLVVAVGTLITLVCGLPFGVHASHSLKENPAITRIIAHQTLNAQAGSAAQATVSSTLVSSTLVSSTLVSSTLCSGEKLPATPNLSGQECLRLTASGFASGSTVQVRNIATAQTSTTTADGNGAVRYQFTVPVTGNGGEVAFIGAPPATPSPTAGNHLSPSGDLTLQVTVPQLAFFHYKVRTAGA